MLLLAGLAWGGGVLYWHFRIERLISTLDVDPEFEPAIIELIRARSRAIPYLVREVSIADSANNVKKMGWSIKYLSDVVDASMEGKKDLFPEHESISWRFSSGDAPAQLKEKCAEVQRWWMENANCYPRRWEFWASRRIRGCR